MIVAILIAAALQESRPAHIEDDGWLYRGASGQYATMWFTRVGPRASMVWSRFELSTAERGIRSLRQLDEMNCETGQYRTVQQTSFAEPNLGGTATVIELVPQWEYPAPGTFSEGAYRVVCP